MATIDFHNHFYPPEYLQAIQKGPSNIRVTIDDAGNPQLHYPGDYNVAVRGHRDIAYRTEVLEQAGIDLQVITLTTPGTHIEEPPRAVALARLVNDAFARIVSERDTRFSALQTLLGSLTGKAELEALADRYAASSPGIRPARMSLVTYCRRPRRALLNDLRLVHIQPAR